MGGDFTPLGEEVKGSGGPGTREERTGDSEKTEQAQRPETA